MKYKSFSMNHYSRDGVLGVVAPISPPKVGSLTLRNTHCLSWSLYLESQIKLLHLALHLVVWRISTVFTGHSTFLPNGNVLGCCSTFSFVGHFNQQYLFTNLPDSSLSLKTLLIFYIIYMTPLIGCLH